MTTNLLSPDSIRSVDGTGNNLTNANLGATQTGETRIAPANFAPNTNNTLIDAPNAREISNALSSGEHADDHDSSGLSANMYVWGQFLDHDLDRTPQDNTHHIDIAVPSGDPDVSDSSIPLTRFVTDPSTGTASNVVTSWIDGSMVYGSNATTAASLRLPDGHLKTSDGGNLAIVNGGFVSGDDRATENPDLTAITTLFVREHNFQVDRLAQQHPEWTGDQLYQMARAIVGAEIANITYSEFLPHLLGPNAITPYNGYDSTVDPRISQDFSAGAFRFGHSIVSGEEAKINNQGVELANEDLSQAFFATPDTVRADGGVDALLRNFPSDITQANDVYAIDALRNLLVAPPAFIDLIAIDIQRERDLGLGSLNQTREALGLTPYSSFDQITSDPVVAANLQQQFGSVDNVDLFIGGLAEDHVNDGMVGSTFEAILVKQFTALRDGDRLWWQNQGFDDQTAREIQNTKLSDIIMRDTDTGVVQSDVFVAQERHASDVAPEEADNQQLVMGVDQNGAHIEGGQADDTIVAGLGSDQVLTGGGGSNVFIMPNADQAVTISDFNPAQDKLEFKMSAGDFTMQEASGHTTVYYGSDTATLMGVTADQLSHGNFVLPANLTG